METKIFVIYIGIAGIRSEDIDTYVNKVLTIISPKMVESEIIVIPEQSYNTRIECINPKYITDEELIKENTEKMKTLRNYLNNEINRLKNEKQEN